MKARETELLVVLQSPRDKVIEFVKRHGIPFPCLADPQGDTYQLYLVPKANWGQYLSPKTLLPVLKATLSGFFHGKFEGEERQLPGLFIIDKKGVLRFKYIGQHPADSLSLGEVLKELERLSF